MKASKPDDWLAEPSVEAMEKKQDFERVIGMSGYRRQVYQAGKLRAIYNQSPAQYYMTFQQFQKPGTRNRILTENGREKIFTPFDPVPAKRRKQQRRQPKSA